MPTERCNTPVRSRDSADVCNANETAIEVGVNEGPGSTDLRSVRARKKSEESLELVCMVKDGRKRQ